MKKLLTLLCLGLCVIACKQNLHEKRVIINEAQLLQRLKIISHDSLEGRYFGTPGNIKTQHYLAKEFKSLGIAPAFAEGYIQRYPHTFSGQRRQRMYPVHGGSDGLLNVSDTTVYGGNVVAKIEGKLKETIVITAHLDHLGVIEGEIYNGADDNASGVAALVAIGEYFKNNPPKHRLILAAVDAEEIGSLGAEYLFKHFPVDTTQIVLNINMDMISHNDSLALYASGLYHYPSLKEPLTHLNSPIKLLFGHDNNKNINEDDWTFSSDHRVFHKRGIPFVYFGVEDHKDYHEATDVFENINKEFYIEAVKLIIQAIEAYDSYLHSSHD
ncbi:M28 family peptidase [Flavobacteriaceae bacterium F08102]|nr:M28 family peptidase [Flavobacteriaceae bacterium F08102]